jgi:hypothetical protein
MARSRKPVPRIDPSFGELDGWLRVAHDRISRQVNVRETRDASGTKTVVTIDHLLSCDLAAHAGWHVRTRPTFIPSAYFSSEVRTKVKNAERLRGRAIYCDDLLDRELVAAVSYHIDEDSRVPVFLTELGLRKDIAGNAFLRFRTLSGALVLKYHVHVIADKIGRGGYVDTDLAPGSEQLELARELGFRPSPRIKRLRIGGTHLRQPLPGQDSRTGG